MDTCSDQCSFFRSESKENRDHEKEKEQYFALQVFVIAR